MNARVTEPKAGEATVVNIPRADKGQPKAEAPAPQSTPPQAAAPEAPAKKKSGSRRLILMIAVPLVQVVGGGYFWLTGGRYEDTDTAYVQQAKVSLRADIAGRITSVNVGENEPVKAGDVLFTIDPQPYQIAQDQANAALASARVDVQQLKVAFGTANVQLRSAQQTLTIRQAAFDRQNALVKQGVNSNSTLADTKLALQAAKTALDQAKH